jgi:hypothetical protein
MLCFLCGPCRGVIKGHRRRDRAAAAAAAAAEFQDVSLPDMSLGAEELSRQLQNNSKKGIRLWKEDFICDLKLQWDCHKSVARLRLVRTEKPSPCVTLNWKVCRSVIAPSCVRWNISNHPIQNPSYKSPIHVTIYEKWKWELLCYKELSVFDLACVRKASVWQH